MIKVSNFSKHSKFYRQKHGFLPDWQYSERLAADEKIFSLVKYNGISGPMLNIHLKNAA